MIEFFKKHPWAEDLFIVVVSVVTSLITSVILCLIQAAQ